MYIFDYESKAKLTCSLCNRKVEVLNTILKNGNIYIICSKCNDRLDKETSKKQ